MYKVLVSCVFVACVGCQKAPEPFAGCTEDEARETAKRVLDCWQAGGDWREAASQTCLVQTLPLVRVETIDKQPYDIPGRIPGVFVRHVTDLVSYEKRALLGYDILAGEEYTKTYKLPPSMKKSPLMSAKDSTQKYRRFKVNLVFELELVKDAKILVRKNNPGSWFTLFEFPNQSSPVD